MGGWYTVGVFVGLGVALGVLFAAILGVSRAGIAAVVVLAAGGAAVLGAVLAGWPEAVGGAVGGVLGGGAAARVVRATLERGGTRAGTAILVGIAAVVVAAFALVPLVGYLEAFAVPALAARQRRREGSRYAGLRILAKD